MQGTFYTERIKNLYEIYDSAWDLFALKTDNDISDLLQTVKTICLTETTLFELHEISLKDFLKVKISHFSGEGKTARYNEVKYGKHFLFLFCLALKELLKLENGGN